MYSLQNDDKRKQEWKLLLLYLVKPSPSRDFKKKELVQQTNGKEEKDLFLYSVKQTAWPLD